MKASSRPRDAAMAPSHVSTPGSQGSSLMAAHAAKSGCSSTPWKICITASQRMATEGQPRKASTKSTTRGGSLSTVHSRSTSAYTAAWTSRAPTSAYNGRRSQMRHFGRKPSSTWLRKATVRGRRRRAYMSSSVTTRPGSSPRRPERLARQGGPSSSSSRPSAARSGVRRARPRRRLGGDLRVGDLRMLGDTLRMLPPPTFPRSSAEGRGALRCVASASLPTGPEFHLPVSRIEMSSVSVAASSSPE
mmetsp:Transcript_21002/g.70528  ORF Transcript_21002/g.70528 Transcript_21002/m.70528 type:complete len:247 (-) Transcript_21002:327-1067(-)